MSNRDPYDQVRVGPPSDEFDRLLFRLEEREAELAFIKSSRLYTLARRLRCSSMGRAMLRRRANVVEIEALGDHAQSTAWLLHASGRPGEPSVPWDYVAADPSWRIESSSRHPDRTWLVTRRPAAAFLALGPDPELRFLAHPDAGTVRVSFAGRSELLNLRSPSPVEVSVYPARRPMLVPSAPAKPDGPADADDFVERARASNAQVVAVTYDQFLGVPARPPTSSSTAITCQSAAGSATKTSLAMPGPCWRRVPVTSCSAEETNISTASCRQ